MLQKITGGRTMTGDPVYPAENVSDRVVEQVLRGRSGKLFIPEGQYYISFLKFLPTWCMDLVLFGRGRGRRREARVKAEARS